MRLAAGFLIAATLILPPPQSRGLQKATYPSAIFSVAYREVPGAQHEYGHWKAGLRRGAGSDREGLAALSEVLRSGTRLLE
jgi:hypothetical protein